jgi:RHS repeat-associated protein
MTSPLIRILRTILFLVTIVFLPTGLWAQWCTNAVPPPSPPPTGPCPGGPGGGGGGGGRGGKGGQGSAPSAILGGLSALENAAIAADRNGSNGQPTNPKACPTCTGSPCLVSNGSYTTFAADLQLPTNGFPLAVSRTYESGRVIDGVLGVGWILNLSARLRYTTYLYAAPSTYSKEADVLLPRGNRYRFTENTDGTFSPPSNRYDILVKNGDGSFDLTIADNSTKYHFSSTGAMQSITDEFGNVLTFTYDASGRLQHAADASGSGRYFDVSYGGDGRISLIQDHTGRQVHFGYSTDGTLTSVTDPAGRAVNYSYTNVRFAPLLTRITDNWGRVLTDISYDMQGRTNTYTEDGETYTYTYQYNGRTDQSSKVDSAGNRWVYTYAATGQITERDYPPNGASQVIVYNPDNSIQMMTDEVGVKSFYTYALQGRLSSITRDYTGPTTVRFDYTYDANFPAKVISVLPKNPSTNAYDTNWQGWKYDYYQAGSTAPGALWHVFHLRDDGATTDTIATYEYDSHGRMTAATDATNGRTDYAYDPMGNLVTVTAPSNNDLGTRPITTYAYDSLGRFTSFTDPLSHPTTYTYDVVDRIQTVTLPKPSISSSLTFTTTYGYDSFDASTQLLATTMTDPNGNVSTQKYDVFGRLARSVDAAGNTTNYSYTRALLTAITDANGYVTSYAYDGLGRLTSTTFPDSTTETNTYFDDGLLKSKTDRRSQTIQYIYDHLKRFLTSTYPNATTITYTYYGQKLTQVGDTSVSPNETHAFTYDHQYRLGTNTQGSRGTIAYTYDPADRPLTYAISGGPTATYAYYPDGRLSTIQWTPVTGQFKYAYTLTGQYDTITFPNGQTRAYSYDDQGRLLQLANSHPTAGNLATYAYAYDLNNTTGTYTMLGQRTTLTATVPAQVLSSALTKYYYDNRYQLTRVDYPNAPPFNGEVDSWTYDGIGNRLSNTVNGATKYYTYQKLGSNSNNWQRLTSDGTNSYTYDSNGSIATRTGYAYVWDYENRLANMTGAQNAAYAYDYSGRRGSKTVNATATSYLYDASNTVGETTSTTTTYHLFGPGIDQPLATSRGGSILYDAIDGLGSVSVSTAASGTLQNNYLFDAWGVERSWTETFAQPFRYTGREVGDTGDTWYYRARFLEPIIGRFMSEDPLRLNSVGRLRLLPYAGKKPSAPVDRYLEESNSYNYVLNNPLPFIDPRGLAPQTPGCDKIPACFETTHVLDCCYHHDRCYEDNNCTYKSWFYTGILTSPMACVQCNISVVDCVVNRQPVTPAPPEWVKQARQIDPRRQPVWWPPFVPFPQ